MISQGLARKRLFGTQQNTVTLRSVTANALGNAGRAALGRPLVATGIGDYSKSLLQRGFEWLIGVRLEKTVDERLPRGWPVDVFRIVAEEIESKTGTIKLDDGVTIPAFNLTTKGAAVLPYAWISNVKPSSRYSDYKKVIGLDDSIREALAQKGHKLTVRIMQFPLRVEIDRPDAQIVKLSEDWDILKSQPVNQHEYVTGIHYDSALKIGIASLCDGREFSGIVAGASGSGKSQWAMAMMLSAALNTGPEQLSIVLCDPKNIDFRPLEALPHMAHGKLLTEVDECRAAIMAVLAEMDRRTRAGDRSVMGKRILLYIDELPDLLDQDDGSIEAALVRLTQKGRAWGINVFVAAQKATSDIISTRALANLAVRIVLRVSSFHEATHVSGQAGCAAHKLAGNGAALIYNAEHNTGMLSQTHFVASADDPAFDRIVGDFIDDIRTRWAGCRPHWRYVAAEGPEMVAMMEQKSTDDWPTGFSAAATALYESNRDGFSIRAIRRLHQQMYGSEPNPNRAKELRQKIVSQNEGGT